MEDIRYGERIRTYQVEALMPDSTWQTVAQGTAVGHKRIQRFKPLHTKQIRLKVTQATATAVVRDFAAFSVG